LNLSFELNFYGMIFVFVVDLPLYDEVTFLTSYRKLSDKTPKEDNTLGTTSYQGVTSMFPIMNLMM